MSVAGSGGPATPNSAVGLKMPRVPDNFNGNARAIDGVIASQLSLEERSSATYH